MKRAYQVVFTNSAQSISALKSQQTEISSLQAK